MVPMWILVAAVTVLAAGLVLLSAFYLVIDLRHSYRRRRMDRARRQLQAVMPQIMDGSLPRRLRRTLGRLPSRQRAELLADYATSVDSRALRDIAMATGLHRRARRWVKRLRWYRRLWGLRVLDVVASDRQIALASCDDRHPLVRAQATSMLEVNRREAIDVLLRHLGDRHRVVRAASKDALVRGGFDVVNDLVGVLKAASSDELVLAEGLEVARTFADPRFLEASRGLCDHPAPEVRWRAVRVVSTLLPSGEMEILTAALTDSDGRVREAAVAGIAQAGHVDGVAAVARLLDDDDWSVRRAAAEALGDLGPSGLLLLRTARTSGSPRAAGIASVALAAIESR